MTVHASRATGVRRPPVLGTIAAAVAVGLSGCGPDLGTPEGVTTAFVDAMAERDWETACGLLSHDLVHRATDGNSQYCPGYLERRHPDTSRYGTLAVQGDAVTTPDGHRLEVAPEDAPGRAEEVLVVEESGRLVLMHYPGRDASVR